MALNSWNPGQAPATMLSFLYTSEAASFPLPAGPHLPCFLTPGYPVLLASALVVVNWGDLAQGVSAQGVEGVTVLSTPTLEPGWCAHPDLEPST